MHVTGRYTQTSCLLVLKWTSLTTTRSVTPCNWWTPRSKKQLGAEPGPLQVHSLLLILTKALTVHSPSDQFISQPFLKLLSHQHTLAEIPVLKMSDGTGATNPHTEDSFAESKGKGKATQNDAPRATAMEDEDEDDEDDDEDELEEDVSR